MSGAKPSRRALALSAALSGCTPSAYVCSDDAQCQAGGVAGWCEAGGYCSFEDDACPGGRRYGDYAPPSLSGTCVSLDDGTSGTSGTSSTPTPTTPTGTADSTTEDQPPASEGLGESSSSSSSSSSTGSPTGCPGDWWDCDWRLRQGITVSPLTETPLEGFPIPVRLEGELARAADDLRFVGPEGTLLDFEREADVAWVVLPTLPAEGVSFHAYFANPDASPPEAAPLWSDYALVLHGDQIADATGVNVASDGLDIPSVDGQIGPALSFGGQGDVIIFPPDPSLADLRDDGFTISCWLWVSSDPGNDNFPRLVDNANAAEASTGWSVMFSADTFPAELVRVDLGLSTSENRTTFPAVTIDGWMYLAITIAGDLVTARYDDTTVAGNVTTAGAGTPSSDADNPVAIGASAYDVTRAFIGQIDELRVVRGARDDAWLSAEYHAALPEAVVLGEVELAPDE